MIGCSPISGGLKQFIMSGTRMDFHIPTVRSVRAMVDQLPNRGREAEMLQEMGFDPNRFRELLKRHNGDIQAIMAEMLK